MRAADVSRSGSPAVRKGMKAFLRSFRKRVNRPSIAFIKILGMTNVGCMDAERNAPAPREARAILGLRGAGALRSASMHPTKSILDFFALQPRHFEAVF